MQVAIVGCGVIGPVHAAAIGLDRRAKLRWACDLDVKKATARVPEAARYTAEAAEVFSDPAVDLVCVCTPHPTHADLACAALEAGKHVVVEKPLGSHPEQINRLLAAAFAHPRQVASGIFQHRFTPLARRLRELITGGDFGPVRRLNVEFRCTRDDSYYRSAPWRGTWDGEGGGVSINQAIHTFDLGLWISGLVPREVAGRMERRRMTSIEVEDRFSASVRCDGGLEAELLAENDGITGWQQRIVIECARGRVELGDDHRLATIDHPSLVLAAELAALDQARPSGLPQATKLCYGEQHAVQLRDVLDAIEAGRPPMVTLADAATANLVVLAAYHATATGQPAILPLSDYRHPVLTMPNT